MKERIFKFFTFTGEYALYGLLFSLAVSNAAVEFFAALMLISFLGRKTIKPELRYLMTLPNVFLLSFLLFSVLSLLNSGPFLDKSIHALSAKWTQYLGIYIIVQDSVYDQKTINRGIWVFLSGAFLAVLSGLSQHFFGVEFLRNRAMLDATGRGALAITSTFGHFNGFGAYLVVVLPLVAASLLSRGSFHGESAGLFALLLFSIMAIILTYSRGSWLALSVSFIFFLIFARKHFKWLIPIFFVVIIMFISPQLHERLFFTFMGGGDNGRFLFWSAAKGMMREHPFFGVGVGTFMANFSKYATIPDISYAHNCYLQVWAETGIFALVSFVGFVVSLGYIGIKKFIIGKDLLLLGLLSGFVGFLIHSFFDVDLYSLRLAILFWAWGGLIAARLRAPCNE